MFQPYNVLQVKKRKSSCFFPFGFIFFVTLISVFILTTTNLFSAGIILNWNPNSEANLAGYKIYSGGQSGTYNNIIDVGNTTNYTFSVTESGDVYCAMSAYDTEGNESDFSAEIVVNVSVGDTTPPSTPGNIQTVVISTSQIDISWDASTDNTGVTGYKIYRDGVVITTIQALSDEDDESSDDDDSSDEDDESADTASATYQDTGLSASTTYNYAISAIDAQGNESGQSTGASATTLPVVVANNSPVLTPIGDKTVNEGQQLSFTISATDIDGDAPTYSVSNLPTWASFNSSTQTFSWTPTFVQSGTYSNLTFQVSDGTDIDSETITITVVDVNRPPALNAISDVTVTEGDTVTFNPTASDPDGNALTFSYSGWMNTSSKLTVKGDVGVHTVTVTVSDGSLTVSQDVTVTVTIATIQITLNWNPNTEIDLAGYKVHFGSSSKTYDNIIDVGNTTTYTMDIPASGDTYCALTAYNTSGNESSFSNEIIHSVSTGTVDTTLPSTPVNVKAVAISATQIDLSWDALTDNIGVTGYKIYRDGFEIANTANTTYQDTGLFASTTYSYTISAIDAAGNESVHTSASLAITLEDTTESLPEGSVADIPEDPGIGIPKGPVAGTGGGGAGGTGKAGAATGGAGGTGETGADKGDTGIAGSTSGTGETGADTGGTGGTGDNEPPILSFESQLIIANLKVNSGKAYEVVLNGLQTGARAYIDSDVTFTEVPSSLQGATYIMTANDDSGSRGRSFITFDVKDDVTIYVANENITTERRWMRLFTAKPIWMRPFTDTGVDIATTNTSFSIYEKDFSAGRIKLGGNGFIKRENMYTIIIVEKGKGLSVPTNLQVAKTRLKIAETKDDGFNRWKPLPLRTQAQSDIGLQGGEGMQEIWGLSYAPSNPDILYLVTDTSQVWKSENGGDSWQMKHNGFLANGGVSLVVDPNNENVVFVAGSSHHETESSDIADGIYRTKDGGEAWELVRQTPFYRLKDKKFSGSMNEKGGVNFDFSKLGIIYAGTHEDGLLRSLDGGDTWDSLSLHTLTGKILDVKNHPKDFYSIFLAAENGIYKITDDEVSEMVETNAHFFLENKSFCVRCHSDWVLDEMEPPPDDNIFNPIPSQLNKTETCLGCHNVADETHPVNIVPEQATPADLPLGKNGEITCLTCHYTHGPRESDVPYVSETTMQKVFSFGHKSYKTYYLRRPNPKGELCNACHLSTDGFSMGDVSAKFTNDDD